MIRNVLAVIAGLAVGSIVNMGLITLGHAVIALPPGSDVSTMEGLAAAMPNFGPEHFIFPFLAHAGGALVGTLIATLIAIDKSVIAVIMGVIFLIGGIAAVIMFPAPLWYDVIDILLAYIPMAWIGAKLGGAWRG